MLLNAYFWVFFSSSFGMDRNVQSGIFWKGTLTITYSLLVTTTVAASSLIWMLGLVHKFSQSDYEKIHGRKPRQLQFGVNFHCASLHVCFYFASGGGLFSQKFLAAAQQIGDLCGDGLWIARSQKFLTHLHPGSFTSPKFHHVKRNPDHLSTINFQGQTRCWTSGGNQCILRIVPKCLLSCTRRWFQICFIFTPTTWEMIQFDYIIFFKWVGEKPPTSCRFSTLLQSCMVAFVFLPEKSRLVGPWQLWCDDRKRWCIVTFHGIMKVTFPTKGSRIIHRSGSISTKNKTQKTTYPERQNPERFSFLISSERTD